MSIATSPETQLDRAFVQGAVIDANLQHLTATLASVDEELCSEVRCCTESFERCLQHLQEANETAAHARATVEDPHGAPAGAHRGPDGQRFVWGVSVPLLRTGVSDER